MMEPLKVKGIELVDVDGVAGVGGGKRLTASVVEYDGFGFVKRVQVTVCPGPSCNCYACRERRALAERNLSLPGI